ncbi:hypothetical protein MANES_10G131400v8 [Manihot esculenta]|uniref:Uncharacterized protein n=1 Tax=Manihot esculenta TaxID=3983 RepID=A0ACB7H0E3_MANES|nr:hypothetical protein MANES_10G131400v8 [Manihot esculenta]
METETEKRKPVALFMAFGTKGDVYPIAAIAAAFAYDKKQYHVVLVTHSAHENLRSHLEDRHVAFLPIKSPPVLSIHTETEESTFSLQKRIITREHRQECYSVVEGIFGNCPSMEGDFIVINFFALEGWSLAEHFRVRCVVASPYVIPYSAPSSFECRFRKELPLLYEYLQEAPTNKVCWKDVIHWMWPLFTESWGSWRSDDLNLSPIPFTDPVTGLPSWHDWPPSPLLLYGFSNEIVECPDYWPSHVHVCGFWFLPIEWQFACNECGQISAFLSPGSTRTKEKVCAAHVKLQCFLGTMVPPVFIGLSSAGSLGFLEHPEAFLKVIQIVLEITDFSTVPYNWLFRKCLAAVHHGGSGSTAAALHAGIPQVICPFMLDQFYWAERMHWLGVAPEPLKRNHLVPDKMDDFRIRVAANVLSRAIADALSPEVKIRAQKIAEMISLEDGVMEAVRVLKQEMNCSN